MKNKNIIFILILVIMFIAFYNIQISNKKNNETTQKKAPVPVVSALKIKSSSIKNTIRITGSVEPYHTARLATPAEGPIIRINVREGDSVKKDQPLIIIGRKQGTLALIESLEEELKKESENLQRTTQLVKSRAIPQERLDQAKSSYEKVNAQLIKARETAEDYTIKAPWDGIISDLPIREGEFVAPRQAVVEMYDPDTLIIRSTVAEKYSSLVSKDMKLRLTLDAFEGKELSGKIKRVYPYLDSRLRTRPIEIILDTKEQLLPGMLARIDLTIEKKDNIIKIPVSAIKKDKSGNDLVFVIKDKKTAVRKIKTGIIENNNIEVISGLKENDIIITKGNENLKENIQVKVSDSTQGRKTR
ncbi:MAG: efflux RND transporter periplasmic adaptor subunit [Candidatus Muiribacterium halophilum]|uniref:Efflux RND transporter periplasmic adaptor subunit n=1 Tax=Muiribacterium halophilum TaxID=2053465 RepID=A0A2N5ZIP7_MUIH1|nr:MAG: efflux RND transporter periplasmic adaptor subunit [Candidatus Muirbacterium halophilum]